MKAIKYIINADKPPEHKITFKATYLTSFIFFLLKLNRENTPPQGKYFSPEVHVVGSYTASAFYALKLLPIAVQKAQLFDH